MSELLLRRQDDKEQNRPAQLIIPDTERSLPILAIIFLVLHKIASMIYKYNQRENQLHFPELWVTQQKLSKERQRKRAFGDDILSCLVISWNHNALW